MNRPNKELLILRPVIAKATIEASGSVEAFQNSTIRPIIKLQHDVILWVFDNEKQFQFAIANSKNEEDYRRIASVWLQKQPKVRNLLLGVIIGHFTLEEMRQYQLIKQELNKRIIQMILQRLTDTRGTTLVSI